MAMDSMLCRFKATYPAERIDSVRSLLEDKERQMFQIVRLMDEQQSINKKIANQIPVIVQKSVQEQSKKPKRKGFLGIFGKKEGTKPTTTTTTLRSSNRNMVNEQKAQSRRLSEQADSLAARNAELNRQLQELICQIEEKVQTELQSRENEIVALREYTDTFSVGWHFNQRFEGKGLAYEAATGLLDYLFHDSGARRIYGFVEDDNLRSKRLCERLGMRHEGCMKEFISFVCHPDGAPRYEDTCIYAILNKEWKSNRQR